MNPIKLSLKDIFNLPGAAIYNPDSFKAVSSVSIDSRRIRKYSLFIAIKGEKFDGHNFVNTAVKKGASAIMINKNYLNKINDSDIPVITVPDTTKALGDVAKIWRSKLNAKVIGLTGSSGKTTTKEMISALLSEKFKVNKTAANNNNHIGVPLTILSTRAKHQVLVVECGTNHFGEIPYISNILQPDYALITNIGDSHLEYLKDRQGVLKEKSTLLEAASKRKGRLFINTDDELILEFSKKFRNKIKYGFGSGNDVSGKIISYDAIGRAELEIQSRTNRKKLKLKISQPGEAAAKNFLAASAVGFEFGLKPNEIINASRKIKSSDKRVVIKVFKTFTILDDTYNANPDSMRTAISILSMYKNRRRKIAVLGDMFELGSQAKRLHEELADFIKTQNVDEVFVIGKMMKYFTKIMKDGKLPVQYFESKELLKKHLKKVQLRGSVILVKGSRGMKMEEFVSVIESRAK
ncbi:MAG: UDP-N-acetylmuramoyl-tripeptide--D-alanyl-D-alanine ligase [Ignavibacteriaceae bacterium]